MPVRAVTTRTFCIALDFLQSRFWNGVMLLQDWSYHYRSFTIVTTNSWIVTVYRTAPWNLICSPCHGFPFPFFFLPSIWLFKSKGRLPYRCNLSMLPVFSWVPVAHFLLWIVTVYPSAPRKLMKHDQAYKIFLLQQTWFILMFILYCSLCSFVITYV